MEEARICISSCKKSGFFASSTGRAVYVSTQEGEPRSIRKVTLLEEVSAGGHSISSPVSKRH